MKIAVAQPGTAAPSRSLAADDRVIAREPYSQGGCPGEAALVKRRAKDGARDMLDAESGEPVDGCEFQIGTAFEVAATIRPP
jgi:hypothetical protein